jgi:hypothetical protein
MNIIPYEHLCNYNHTYDDYMIATMTTWFNSHLKRNDMCPFDSIWPIIKVR